MEAAGKIELKQRKARDYSTVFLKRNPFPAIGVPTDILVTVDRESVIERFQNVIAELQDNDTGIITVLVGAYGSGKSHLLKSFKQNVNDQLLSTDDGTIASYVKSPGEDFRDFLLGFIEDIGRSLLTAYAAETIKDFIDNQKTTARKLIHDNQFLKSFDADTYDIGEYLNASQHMNVLAQVEKAKFGAIRSKDLVSAFLMLPHPENGSAAWRWFLGQRLDKASMVLANVDSCIDDPQAAYFVFSEFLNLLSAIGIKSVVILVDELEKITLLSSGKRAKYQDMLRGMIDDHNKNVCFYFAIAPKQWEELTKQATALVRRLSGNWYELEDFENAYTSELIEKYLFPARTDTFSAKEAKARFPGCEPSLCPFTKEAVDKIQELSGGRISSILLVCRKLLEYQHDYHEKYDSITKGLVDFVSKQEKLS